MKSNSLFTIFFIYFAVKYKIVYYEKVSNAFSFRIECVYK